VSGEGGRRIDAIVLGSGWEVGHSIRKGKQNERLRDPSEDPDWRNHQFHFHLLTSILPYLIRQPPERNIRIITLISPTYSSALPTLEGKPLRPDSAVQSTGAKAIRTLYLMRHFQLILDTLASALHSSFKPIPKPDIGDGVDKPVRRREEGLRSNVMGLSVIMPWTRNEVIRGALGIEESWFWWLL
jgi:hypothetical protein